MNSKLKSFVNIFGISIVLAVFSFWIINSIKKKEKLKKDFRYTIATIIKRSSSVNGGPYIDFIYFVSKNNYDGCYDTGGLDSLAWLNRRFYLKYNTKDLSNANIMLNMPVPESIKEALPDGWGDIP